MNETAEIDLNDKSKLRLTYFDLRGRSEASHLMLVDSGVPFEDHRIKSAAWFSKKEEIGPEHGHRSYISIFSSISVKSKGLQHSHTAFSVLPVLNVPTPTNGSSFTLSESNAIMSYIEDEYAIDPNFRNRDPLTRAKYNMIKDATVAFHARLIGSFFRHVS